MYISYNQKRESNDVGASGGNLKTSQDILYLPLKSQMCPRTRHRLLSLSSKSHPGSSSPTHRHCAASTATPHQITRRLRCKTPGITDGDKDRRIASCKNPDLLK